MNLILEFEYLAKKKANGIPKKDKMTVEIVAVNRLRLNASHTCGRVSDSRIFEGSRKVKIVARGIRIYPIITPVKTSVTM